MASIVVRPLVPTDATAVRALAAGLRRWFSPPDLRHIDELLVAQPSGWVALYPEGQLVGFLLDTATATPSVREIAWMAVAADRQGQGIGTLLLEQAVASMAAAGVRTVEVSTVAESADYAPYAATRAFYHARDFADHYIDRDYYWPGGDRLVLRRTLDPPLRY